MRSCNRCGGKYEPSLHTICGPCGEALHCDVTASTIAHGRREGAAIAAGIIALGEWGRRCGTPVGETGHRCLVGYHVGYPRSTCPYCSRPALDLPRPVSGCPRCVPVNGHHAHGCERGTP